MSKNNSLYDAMVHTMSRESAEKERTLVNRLNAAKRYMGDIFKTIQAILDEMKDEDRLDSASMLEIFKYLLDYDKIDLWNPIKDNDPLKPNMEVKRLLGEIGELTAEEYLDLPEDANKQVAYHQLSDVEKLRVNQLADGGKCGISIFRLAQITYGVGKRFLEGEEIYNLKGKELKKLHAGDYDDTLLEYAEKYHSGKKVKPKKAHKNESKKDEVPTLEMFEEGKISPKDVEDDETLEQWYEQVDSAGKKGAITQELNKRKQEAERN